MNIRTLLILFSFLLGTKISFGQEIPYKQEISFYQKKLVSPTNETPYPTIDKQSPYYDNFLLLKSFSELKEGAYWSAYWDLKKTYNNVQKKLEINPQDTLSGLMLSIISTTLSVIPQEYDWAMKLVGLPKININTFKYINKAKQNSNWLIRFEAYTSNLLLDTFFYKNENDKLLEEYINLYGDNYYGKIVLSWVLNKKKKHQENIILLEKMSPEEIDNFGYFYYLLGTSYFYVEDYSNAKLFLNYYINENKNDYIKVCKYRLLLIDWLIENKNQYKIDSLKKDIELSGNDHLNLDRAAHNFSIQKELPNKQLMYSRILYDGGNYNEADSILSDLEITQISKNDILEYNYRYARVKQALNDTTLAIKYYLNVIEEGGAKPKKYFTANAALNLGIIYQDLNDKHKARFYYEKAYSYPKHAYKNSIDSEAKRRLNTL